MLPEVSLVKMNLSKSAAVIEKLYFDSTSPCSVEEERGLQLSYKTKYQFRKITPEVRRKISEMKLENLDERSTAQVWAEVFIRTPYMGLGNIAVDYFKRKQKNKKIPLSTYWPLIHPWVNKIENWIHGDMAASLYSQILEEDSKTVYPYVRAWSFSGEPWKKRMGMVSLLYYRACRRKVLPFNKMIPLVKKNLKTDHYFVQKAVGWTLRELHNAYPRETKIFLNRYIAILSPYAFTAATEKIPMTQKEPWKKLRKEASQQRNFLLPWQPIKND